MDAVAKPIVDAGYGFLYVYRLQDRAEFAFALDQVASYSAVPFGG